jgi:Pathogenicity locus
MHPSKVRREQVRRLTDLPNVGPATEGDLKTLGIESPEGLIGRDAYEMHAALEKATGIRHDPCMIDVFLSITRFMEGHDPKPWWDFTAERKRKLADEQPSNRV